MWPFKKPKPTDDQQLVSVAYQLLQEYRSAYAAEWTRIDHCERLYRGDHWDEVPQIDPNEPRPVTPILQSTIENVSADLMDRMPQAIIRPQDPRDKEVADVINALIDQNHDAAHYRQEFSKIVHDLLTVGYCVQETGYDTAANRGMGGAFIRYVDARNIMFDPQAEEIQDGRAVIKIAPRTVQWLEQRYPEYAGQFYADDLTTNEDQIVTYDQTKSVLMIEYWWKDFDLVNGVSRVHMAIMAGRKLLEDSRRQKPDGYFADGEYPFVVTPLLRRKASPLGFGFADAFGKQQMYLDKLDQIVLKNAVMASHNKMLVTEASGFDAEDLADWAKEVHTGQSLAGVTWFSTPPLPQYLIGYIREIRENIKDNSGANDFSRGNTASGVTAASAISALQEMSSKRSRKISMLLYEDFKKCVRREIEIEREFNMFERDVMLVRDGEQRTATFESAMLSRQTDLGNTVPIEFFVSIKVEQENRWTNQAQNETVLQMVQLGVLKPQQAVQLMTFDGKDLVLDQAAQGAPQQPEEQLMAQELERMPTPETAIA